MPMEGGGDIVIGYCQLKYADTTGTATYDAVLREAKAGISGSGLQQHYRDQRLEPVDDETAGKLCGMVVRGGMNGTMSDIRFIDAFDIKKFLEGINAGATGANYQKIMPEYRK